MAAALTIPTQERVRAACKDFDQENLIVEQALNELFGRYPGNNDLPHVLLKVAALNSLYSTQIFAVVEVARNIYAQDIDSALAAGSPEIVDKIARITIRGRERNNYSFATKYCSWHRPALYPIWDSHVDAYLWRLQKQSHFAKDFDSNAVLWNFGSFREVTTAFRDFYGLGSFTFKEIDKFLWSCSGESPSAGTASIQPDPLPGFSTGTQT
ncbi:MAG: hypothetical protein WCB12_09495 [Bryobacteraceae bacterium]